jgi:uncharacterized protein YigA (DUF484 family)
MPASDPAQQIDDAAVAAWLRKNPAFFHGHAELLMELSIPHESGKAISLLERQVAVFRERQSSLQDQIHEFIGNARNNDNLFEKTRLVILDILRAETFPAVLNLMTERLRADFDASASALVFVSDAGGDDSVTRLSTVSVKAALGDLFAKQRTYCGALNQVQQQLLFPGQSAPIVSAAIVPLHLPDDSAVRTRYGLPLLLIGSAREQHFNSSLDTLFLDFIGEVLAVRLQGMKA